MTVRGLLTHNLAAVAPSGYSYGGWSVASIIGSYPERQWPCQRRRAPGPRRSMTRTTFIPTPPQSHRKPTAPARRHRCWRSDHPVTGHPRRQPAIPGSADCTRPGTGWPRSAVGTAADSFPELRSARPTAIPLAAPATRLTAGPAVTAPKVRLGAPGGRPVVEGSAMALLLATCGRAAPKNLRRGATG
jgi:hypothetical protein